MAYKGPIRVPMLLLSHGERERGALYLHELSPERQAEVRRAMASEAAPVEEPLDRLGQTLKRYVAA